MEKRKAEALWEAWLVLNNYALELRNEEMFQHLAWIERELESQPGMTDP